MAVLKNRRFMVLSLESDFLRIVLSCIAYPAPENASAVPKRAIG
jgi:hypothetical protein